MFRPQAQAETHSRAPGTPRASSSYFFLFISRLQAQAHSGPESSPRGSHLNLFFFIYI